MSEKTTRIIGWVLIELLCIAVMFFILFYGLNSDTLNMSIYIGMGISLIVTLVIAFVLGRASVSLSLDPLERLKDAYDYSNKLLREQDKKKKTTPPISKK